MVALLQESWTVEKYRAFLGESQVKYEYDRGILRMMAGGTLRHNRIGFNLGLAFGRQLNPHECAGYSSDQAVKIGEERYAFPDLTIVCGAAETDPTDPNTLTNPALLVEVLSPTTEAYDRGDKAAAYRALPGLRAYLLVAQDKPHIELYTRQPDDSWLLREARGLAAALEVAAVGCVLALADVYSGVSFEDDGAAAPTRPEPA
jgi:Uma2 family endonuclease